MPAIPGVFGVQLFPPLAVVIAAIMTRTDRKIITRLRDADANTAERAVTLEPISGFAAMRLQRLRDGGAVVATADGRYFMDPDGWVHLRAERRRRAGAAIAVVLFAGALVFLFAR